MADKKVKGAYQPPDGGMAGSGGRMRRNKIDAQVDEAVTGKPDNDKRHPATKRYGGRPNEDR